VTRASFATRLLSTAALVVLIAACGRGPLPPGSVEKPAPEAPGLDTAEGVMAFWSNSCAGCHGADGREGAARPLNDPLWWRTMPDAQVVEAVAVGLGRLMPGFSSRAKGGPYIAYAHLGDADMQLLVKGLRAKWETPGEPAPAGSAVKLGDAKRGEAVFANSCVSCHAENSRDSVTNPLFLANITDQGLWSAVVFGRPDLGKPASDLASAEIADVVAYLASKRPSWASEAAMNPPLPSSTPAPGGSDS
jgi:cytochrome c oxidase cbb3-type subunit 3